MGVVPLLVVCSVLVAGGFLLSFIIAAHGGQYDDLDTPSVRMVFDDVLESNESSLEQSQERGLDGRNI